MDHMEGSCYGRELDDRNDVRTTNRRAPTRPINGSGSARRKGEDMWIISVRTLEGEQLAHWIADALPDVQAIKAYFAQPVRVVQYRFL